MTFGKLAGLVLLVVLGGFLLYRYGVIEKAPDGSLSISNETLSVAQIDPYTEADALFMRAKYSDAMTRYREAIGQSPSDSRAPAAKFRIARCLEKLGRNHDAAAAYGAFIQTYPKDNRVSEARKKQEMLSGV